MLDELLLGGEVQETSKKNVLKAIAAQDLLQEVSIFVFYLHRVQSVQSSSSRGLHDYDYNNTKYLKLKQKF